MSVNIGNAAYAAAHKLQGSPEFEVLVDELGAVAQTYALNALRADPAMRVDQTSYARGLYDIWVALHGALNNIKPNQVKPPPMPGTRNRNDV